MEIFLQILTTRSLFNPIIDLHVQFQTSFLLFGDPNLPEVKDSIEWIDDGSAKAEADMQRQLLEMIGVERSVQIWQWLIDSENFPEPKDLKQEELVAVYYRNLNLLGKMKDVVESVDDLNVVVKNMGLNTGPLRI